MNNCSTCCFASLNFNFYQCELNKVTKNSLDLCESWHDKNEEPIATEVDNENWLLEE